MSQSEKDVKVTESSTEAEVVDVQEADVQSVSDVMAEPSLADQLEQVSRQRDEWRDKPIVLRLSLTTVASGFRRSEWNYEPMGSNL